MSSSVGAKAFIPNPALEPLAFLVGEWRTEGTHPMLDGPPLLGLATFSWHASGAFLEIRTEVDHPQIPDGLAYIGSELAQTMTTTRQPDGTLVSRGRMSQDGGPWGDDLSQTFRRVT